MTYSVDDNGGVNGGSDSDPIFGFAFTTCVGVIIAL